MEYYLHILIDRFHSIPSVEIGIRVALSTSEIDLACILYADRSRVIDGSQQNYLMLNCWVVSCCRNSTCANRIH
jgi:hypothetical protein